MLASSGSDQWLRGGAEDILHKPPTQPEDGFMKVYTDYLTFTTNRRQEIIDVTDEVDACRAAAGIDEGMVLVSAMHISSSIFVNDHEPGLWDDILDWLEERIAPWDVSGYRHNGGTGEDNAAAHLRSLAIGHEVIIPVTRAALDLGPWQRVFYGEWDGQRPKRVLLKAMGV
ncbi:MAG: secondary thiamine-phosphate synthase enzyme YjbQ [Vulcanimicrobiaceae bacterium]